MAVRVLYLLVSALLVATANASVIERDTWIAPNEGNSRIVDGTPAALGQFPYQALVLLEGGYMLCSGSLITTTAVLTKGDCVAKAKKWTIRLGGVHKTEDEDTAWIVETIWALTHPEMNLWTHYNDVAIIFLPKEAPLSRYIQLVALPSFEEVDESFVGEGALVAGWGRTSGSPENSEILRWTEVIVVPMEICAQYNKPNYTTQNTLCAGNEYAGAFEGDFGTALVLETEGGFKQIGIHILAVFDGYNNSYPSTFARVTSLLDWITTTAGIDV